MQADAACVMTAGSKALLQGPDQGRTWLLNLKGLPRLRTSALIVTAGPAGVQWHQCMIGDWKMPGSPWYSCTYSCTR